MANKISVERNDLFEPNIYITIMFDIIGDIKSEQFIMAIKKAFTSFEATMSKVVSASDGEACYEKMSKSGCWVKITQSYWLSLIHENGKKPFSIQTGEFMRIFVKPSKEKATVLIMAHHLVGDGKSVIYFIERIMKIYIGDTGVYQPLHLITDKICLKSRGLPRRYAGA